MFLNWVETCCLIACIKEVSKVSFKKKPVCSNSHAAADKLNKIPKGAKH